MIGFVSIVSRGGSIEGAVSVHWLTGPGMRANSDSAAGQLELVLLSPDDVDDVYGLYELSRSISPYGHLAVRTKDDYRELFREPGNVIGTGIRDNGQLVAHSICHRLTANPYRDNPVLAAIDPATSTVFHGDGTVVHPDYQGRHISQRIFRLRVEQMAERRIEHFVALIAIDNIVSIGNALLSGAILVGFRRDETAMNFVVYSGRLAQQVPRQCTASSGRSHERKPSSSSEGAAGCCCAFNRGAPEQARHRVGGEVMTSFLSVYVPTTPHRMEPPAADEHRDSNSNTARQGGHECLGAAQRSGSRPETTGATRTHQDKPAASP